VTTRQPTVRFSIEYKPCDPRRFALIRSMGEATMAVAELDQPNLGATLDFCHSLMAGENPATAASLALRQQRLFGLHLNDGYGVADDGLMVGSVHQRQTLELLWVLRAHEWQGPIYFDTFPTTIAPHDECAANIAAVEHLEAILDRVDGPALAEAQANGDAIAADAVLNRAIIG